MDYDGRVYSYGILIFGDNFYPQNILKKIQGNFVIDDDYFCPTDVRKFWGGIISDDDDIYGYGCMLFSHPLKQATDKYRFKYEKKFVEFIEENYQLFKENGVDDIRIFMEVFYEGQCNFEIFNKTLLKRLAKYNVSLPISIYAFPKRKMQKWEKEINVIWESVNVFD